MDPQQTGVPEPINEVPEQGHGLWTAGLILLLIAAIGFGGWAFTRMQDYKTNSDQKTAVAVSQAKTAQAKELQAKFEEQSKSPYKSFNGSPTYGSITFNYPKTWSAYVDNSNTSIPIDGYFHPGEVPGTESKTAYALRAELLSQDYAQVLQSYSSPITGGKITARAYVPPRMQGVANVVPGTYLTGQINDQDQTQSGSMVIMKVRDKTLKISTESQSYATDFNNVVLSSLTFVP
jgi:hypothetical protein